jgi:hypothetical protein
VRYLDGGATVATQSRDNAPMGLRTALVTLSLQTQSDECVLSHSPPHGFTIVPRAPLIHQKRSAARRLSSRTIGALRPNWR